MRRIVSIAALTLLSGVGHVALAQQGPLLIPPSPGDRSYDGNAFGPSPSHAGSGDQRYPSRSDGYYSGGSRYSPRPTTPSVVIPDVDRTPIRDPQIARIAQWYQQFQGRPMVAAERHNWEIYLYRDTGSLDKVLVQMLGSDEFYKRAGGNFDGWLREVASVTGVRLSPHEAAQWRDAARGTDRLTFAREFLTAKGVIRGVDRVYIPALDGGGFRNDFDPGVQPRRGAGFTGGYTTIGGTLYDGSLYSGAVGSPLDGVVPRSRSVRGARNVISPYIADNAHDGHQHATGYGPRQDRNSPADLIAGWYQTYFGREIAPGELNKWLSDLNRGMSIDEVYASVLAAPEWYNRTGATPPQWISSTLAALGQPNDGNTINYWLDRYRRHDGDRYDTALEMVRGRGGRDRDRDDDRRRRDRRFDDDD